MKSNRINTILLLTMYIVLPVILVLMFHHITLCETLSCMDSGIFGESSALISFESENHNINSFSDISEVNGSFAVFADYDTDEGNVVRAIYFNKSYANLPIKDGRFFKNSDFVEDSFTAVIGKDLEDKTVIKDNKKYININEIDYEVIGVIGYENQTLFDKYIFINGCTMSSVFVSKLYNVDIIKANDYGSFVEELVEELSKDGTACEAMSQTDNFGNKFIPRLLYSRIFILVIILNLICLLLISIQWINQQKRNYCIKRLLGAGNLRVFLSILIKYILFILISCLSGYVYCTLFYSSYLYSLFLGYAILIPLAFIYLLFSMISILRESIEEAIK